jgi:Zn-dependent protease
LDLSTIGTAILQFVVFALAITVHESAHAWTADRLGDPTARMLGRISLNPIVHVDIFGTLIFPVLLYLFHQPIFGWAKPVPVNVLNLRRPRRDSALVSAAGPLSNIVLALAAVFLFRLFMGFDGYIFKLVGEGTYFGISLFLQYCVLINLILAAFNLIPVPPLDGGGILAGILPDNALGFLDIIRPYGFLILIALMYSGAIGVYISVVWALTRVLLGSP